MGQYEPSNKWEGVAIGNQIVGIFAALLLSRSGQHGSHVLPPASWFNDQGKMQWTSDG